MSKEHVRSKEYRYLLKSFSQNARLLVTSAYKAYKGTGEGSFPLPAILPSLAQNRERDLETVGFSLGRSVPRASYANGAE